MLVPAQAQHLKFMGIQLTGTITQFQQKLAAKGVAYDKSSSARADKGTRIFKGTFAGSDATIVVWYDVKSKIVYAAKAFFTCYSTQSRDNKYNEIKSMLSLKYSDEAKGTTQKDGLERYHVFVTDDKGLKSIGSIMLYCRKDLYSYDTYTVHVEYTDTENDTKNENNNMDDL